ncbi:MAG: hypothetical protein Q7J47_15595 [Azoarcus sp.]|nr:hypothetical protein [Azoarcus sp.]
MRTPETLGLISLPGILNQFRPSLASSETAGKLASQAGELRFGIAHLESAAEPPEAPAFACD